MEREEQITALVKRLSTEGFTGFIRISYDLGGVTMIEKNEEILKKRST